MIKVSIVYHSVHKHTEKQAAAVLKGLQSLQEVEGRLIPVEEVKDNWDFINESEAIIFGSPTFMGTISAPFKQFMDETSKIWFKQQWKDKLAAGFVNSGWPSGDKLNTLNQLVIFAAQHGMIWVSMGEIPGDLARNPEKAEVNRLGCFLGAMSCSPFDKSCEVAPSAGDLQTAEILGKRVGEAAIRWTKGKQA